MNTSDGTHSRSVIFDSFSKIQYLHDNAARLSALLSPDGYPLPYDDRYIFVGADYIYHLPECLAALFGLSPTSWKRYRLGTRPFNETHLARLTLFVLYLGRDRPATVQSPFFYQVRALCGGPALAFIPFIESILNGLAIATALSPDHPADSTSRYTRRIGSLYIGTLDTVLANGLSGEELLDRLIALDYLLLHGISSEHEGRTEQWTPIFMDHPDTWRLIFDHTRRIVGYWHFVPLPPDTFRHALDGTMRDSELNATSVVFFELPGWYDIYFVSMGLLPQYRNPRYIDLLITSLIDVLLTLARSGVFIRRVCTHAYTTHGISLCKSLAMTPLHPHIDGGFVYTARLVDIIPRCRLSGHEVLLNSYVQAWNTFPPERAEHDLSSS
jgi:hypothetical protein